MKTFTYLIIALIIISTESQSMLRLLSNRYPLFNEIDSAIKPENINAVMRGTGRPLLVEATTWGTLDQVKRILNLNPNLHVCTPLGETALHAAAGNPRDGDSKLKIMLQHAKNNNFNLSALLEATMGTDYFTPLCMAARNLDINNMRILLEAGAEVTVKCGPIRQESIFYCVCNIDQIHKVTHLQNLPKCIELLCSCGMPISEDMLKSLYLSLLAYKREVRNSIYSETKQILNKYHVQQELLYSTAKKDRNLYLSRLPQDILAEISTYFLYKPKNTLTLIRES